MRQTSTSEEKKAGIIPRDVAKRLLEGVQATSRGEKVEMLPLDLRYLFKLIDPTDLIDADADFIEALLSVLQGYADAT